MVIDRAKQVRNLYKLQLAVHISVIHARTQAHTLMFHIKPYKPVGAENTQPYMLYHVGIWRDAAFCGISFGQPLFENTPFIQTLCIIGLIVSKKSACRQEF